MTFEEALSLIPNGNCLLFVGAGFGHLASNSSGDKLPLGRDLAKLLDNRSGFNSEGDLMISADYFREEMGDSTLIETLNVIFTPTEVSDSQIKIAAQPWKRIYTTNYDDCMELASRKSKIVRKTVDRWHNPSDFKDKRNLVIHLNGSLSTLTASSFDMGFKLTGGSYLAEDLNGNPWAEFFKNDISDCSAAFFVGFSLDADLDIGRIVFNSKSVQEKCFFIVHAEESQKRCYTLKRFGSVERIGAEQFSELLPDSKQEEQVEKQNYNSFSKISLTEVAVNSISDEDRRNLFIFGKYTDGLLARALTLPDFGDFYIWRTKLDSVENAINNGRRNFLVHGDIGNGKTLFVKVLGMRMASKGYNVFILKKDCEDALSDLERINGLQGKRNIVIIEHLHQRKKLLNQFFTFRTDTILITTDRSVYADMQYDWFAQKVGDFEDISLNRLDDYEIDKIVNIFEHNGFWGDMAAVASHRKSDFISDPNRCNRSLRSLLLKLLNTESIRLSLDKAIQSLNSKASFRDALILMLVSSYLNLGLDVDSIAFGLNKPLSYQELSRDSVIREFLDLRDGTISVRSPLVAEVLLGNIVDIESIKDVLVRAFRQFDHLRNEKTYSDILANLLTFRTLRQPLRGEPSAFHRIITSYYEEIKSCSFCQRNPLFWLQYAIAVMDERDYPSAEIYFKSAYSFAEARENFDKYQIDNHFARYLLESSAANDIGDQYMKIFRQTHQILTKPSHRKEQKYYPFKVARHYCEFFDRYQNRFTEAERKEISDACTLILSMIGDFRRSNPDSAWRRDVKECEINMNLIINKINLSGL